MHDYLGNKYIGGGLIGYGLRGIGSTRPEADPLPGVTRDVLSRIFCPSSAAEWTTVMTAAGIASGNPSSLWTCQEASGPLIDQIGANNLAQGGGLANVYRQNVSGWGRKAVGGDLFFKQNACDIETEKTLLLAFGTSGNPSVPMFLGDPGVGAQLASVGVLAAYSAGSSVSGAVDPGTGVHAWVLQVTSPGNAAGTVLGLTEAEKLATVSDTALTGTYVSIGFFGASLVRIMYLVLFRGAAADLTAAQIKTLLQTLGLTVAWTP